MASAFSRRGTHLSTLWIWPKFSFNTWSCWVAIHLHGHPHAIQTSIMKNLCFIYKNIYYHVYQGFGHNHGESHKWFIFSGPLWKQTTYFEVIQTSAKIGLCLKSNYLNQVKLARIPYTWENFSTLLTARFGQNITLKEEYGKHSIIS